MPNAYAENDRQEKNVQWSLMLMKVNRLGSGQEWYLIKFPHSA